MKLSTFITGNLEEILVEWEAFALTLLAPGQVMTSLALRDHASQILLAIAQDDDQKQPEAKEMLKKAFADANLPAEIQVYAAKHGWCPPDTQAYAVEQAEKAWTRLLALFKTALA